ncbi:MAG: LPS export ABC transporter periplasmic protein LptC [Bacteroidales bacterium]|nr:LPS export ABC transporter periplasmic protein LptC [Bacteroidales bacterium]
MKTKQAYSSFIQSIAFILMMAMLFSCENEMSTIQSLTVQDTLPSESAYNIVVHYTDSGRLKAVLESPELAKYDGNDPYMLFPQGIHVYFYDSVDALVSEIEADYAINYEKKKLMEVRKNVIIFDHRNQKELLTEVLYWDQKNHSIYNSDFVTIKEDGQIMHGDSMRANENLEHFELFQIRATIDIKDEDTIN